jgi:Paraquat-inducible protein A
MPVSANSRLLALLGLAMSIGLLVPGLIQPVITVRGVLQPAGMADLAPRILNDGISDQAMAAMKPLINPAILPLLEMSPGGLRAALVKRLGDQLSSELRNGKEIEVYQQTRSILGSVRHLYKVGAMTAATLILLFSVIVPFGKALLVSWAVLQRDDLRRRGTLHFVEMIAKWSMADVFAVALFITYLAAQATQATPGSTAASAVAFTASFGTGFYWFAAYCVVSLATQQVTFRYLMAER